MRLSEKLARTDDKIVQLTLRIKNSVVDQMKADVKETDRSVNELAAKLIETSIDLPFWIRVAGDFFTSLERPAFLLIADQIAREINNAADEGNTNIEPVTPALLGMLSPTPMKISDLAVNGTDFVVDCRGEVWTSVVDDPQAFVMNFVARFNLHVPAVLPDVAEAEHGAFRLKPLNPPTPAGLCFVPPLRDVRFTRDY